MGCSFHRPQNRPEPANTGWRGRATVRPDRLSPKLPVNGGRGAPRAMPAPDGDANSHAAVSSSPGDTVSAPCRGSRPGPAALDRLRQWWGPAPARPKPVWSTRRVEHGGQRREAAMGKGLPGGRRQAGNIDYRIEPSSSVAVAPRTKDRKLLQPASQQDSCMQANPSACQAARRAPPRAAGRHAGKSQCMHAARAARRGPPGRPLRPSWLQ